jgi:glycosyl transferase family 25
MKLHSEVIPKFIISLDKNKERQEYLKKEVYPKLTNYFKCAAFDAELDDANEILKDNKIFLTDSFYDKCNEGQLGCFLSHFQLWKYIIKSNLDMAIILEDDVKIYSNFNKIIDTVYENLPVKFDYVHLFIHPDKQNIQYLEGKDGDIIPAEDNFGTVAYIISLRGAKRLVKLTELLKIQAPVDRQINFCIRHNFIKAFMIKKPFLLTQGEIMPNRGIYDNSFKSTIWYSKKLKDVKKIREEYIKLAGFTDEDVEKIDNELVATKKKNENVEVEAEKEDPIIIKKIEVELHVESEKDEPQETEEEQILNSVITRLNEI